MERVEEPTGVRDLLVREDLVDPQGCLGCESGTFLTHTRHDGGDEGPVAEGVGQSSLRRPIDPFFWRFWEVGVISS